MNQEQVRSYVERYFAAFAAHVLESHPAYITVKLPEIVDKDIGNRPFYWSWVEKMNLPPQPLVLTFCFDPEHMPEGKRWEHLHFGAGRMAQIFRSAQNRGRYVCLYEQDAAQTGNVNIRKRPSTPLTPWLNVNLRVSFICDKKRDVLLSYGINLHQPAIVDNFYAYLCTRRLGPTIPDYFYTLERKLSLAQAAALAEREVEHFIAQQDQRWAEEARARLEEEISIISAYYDHLIADKRANAENETAGQADHAADATEPAAHSSNRTAEIGPPLSDEQPACREPLVGRLLPSDRASVDNREPLSPQLLPVDREQSLQRVAPLLGKPAKPLPSPAAASIESAPRPAAAAPPAKEAEENSVFPGGSILAFLRQHTIPETPKEEIDQHNWKQSTPAEEKERRIAELKWQYEPRIEVSLINGGLFFLRDTPPTTWSYTADG